ncbi:MAG: VOC family protein, partial [Rubricoccaceae bacterium]|nr:VOC family protein [Rubricoccaceae bacterium]
RGFHSATVTVPTFEMTGRLLTDVFGMSEIGEEGTRTRLAFQNNGAPGGFLDVVVDSETPNYGLGAGIVHHIAFRARDIAHQLELREQVVEFGLQPTPPINRDYFMSIYFRESGGVLFEIATDPPGMARDEPLDSLGDSLKLPSQHEHLRARLEETLPPIPPEGEGV